MAYRVVEKEARSDSGHFGSFFGLVPGWYIVRSIQTNGFPSIIWFKTRLNKLSLEFLL